MGCLPQLRTTIAVGTALTGGPPRRSQRALLTHWAPALGADVKACVGEGVVPLSFPALSHTRSSPLGAPGPALCPGRVVLAVFPLASPLPSTTSATGVLFGGFAGTRPNLLDLGGLIVCSTCDDGC